MVNVGSYSIRVYLNDVISVVHLDVSIKHLTYDLVVSNEVDTVIDQIRFKYKPTKYVCLVRAIKFAAKPRKKVFVPKRKQSYQPRIGLAAA